MKLFKQVGASNKRNIEMVQSQPNAEFDYVVVGGGTAGCVVAARLSEDRGCTVCLIEAGGSDALLSIRVPMLSFIAISRPSLQWDYQIEPLHALGGRRMAMIQAKVMGGGSSINGLMYTRGASGEYDRWDVPGWTFNDLLPYFKRSETNIGGENWWRGGSGPIFTQRAHSPLPIASAFLEAAAAQGYPIVDDLNADVARGFGYVDYTVRNGIRDSSARAFLGAGRRPLNLTILTHRAVRRICISNGRATGVELSGPGPATLSARRGVVVSAGAINSPKLLMLSGIGPADELRRHAIEVVNDIPAVGSNLSNHVSYGLLYEASAPVTAYRYRTPVGAIAGGISYLLRRRGFLAGTSLPIGGVLSTDPAAKIPDINIALSTALVGSGRGAFGMMPATHGFAIVVRQGTPFSRGQVRLRSSDPASPPIIEGNYFSDPRDLATLTEGVHLARAIGDRPELARYVRRELQPGNIADDPQALAEHIRQKAGNIFHPAGTCRLGADDASVVDQQLRVRGVKGLRVADTSVLPTLVTSGTYALALMVGERAAAFIRGSGEQNATVLLNE